MPALSWQRNGVCTPTATRLRHEYMNSRSILIGLVGVGMTGQMLRADISPIVFRVEASNALGAGVWEVPFDEANYDRATDTYFWQTDSEHVIRSAAGETIATVVSAGELIIGD